MSKVQAVAELFLTPVFDFEKNFAFTDAGPWMYENLWIPIVLSVIYVVLVFWGQKAMEKREPFKLRGLLIGWNLFLTVLSWCMMLRLVPALVQTVYLKGWTYSVCNNTYFTEGVTGFWVMIFAVSKVPELLDTAFLVLRKRPVILLHWYHHWTVLVYTWHAYSIRVPSGLWFEAMNSTIHSVMYLYYTLTAMGKRPKWDLYLTTFQTLQMVVGSYITLDDLFRRGCADRTNMIGGAIMYFSYFVLFFKFFLERYFCKSKRKPRAGQTKADDKSAAIEGNAVPSATGAAATKPEQRGAAPS